MTNGRQQSSGQNSIFNEDSSLLLKSEKICHRLCLKSSIDGTTLPSKINMDLCCIKLLKNHYTYCCIIFVVTLELLPRLDDDSVSNVQVSKFYISTQTQAQFLEDHLISFTTGDYRDVIISPTLGGYSVTFIFTNFYKFHPKITTQKPKQ